MHFLNLFFYYLVILLRCSPSSCANVGGVSRGKSKYEERALLSNGSRRGFYRLPLEVIPKRYKIITRPVIEDIEGEDLFTADDLVRIDVVCAYDSKKITLHVWPGVVLVKEDGVELLHKRNGRSLAIKRHRYDPQREFYILDLKGSMMRGEEYELVIPYRVWLEQNDSLGYFRSEYKEPRTGRTHNMVATKLEPVYSRKAFPCFDEPALKATFDISIGRREGYVTLSNMMVKNSEELNGWIWDHYETTPVMSTYLVSIFVSDYVSVSSQPGMFRTPVKVWGPEHEIREMRGGNLGVGAVGKYLEYFEKIFGIQYEVPKIDVVSLGQYPSAAMELWGVPTFKDKSLMYFPGITTEEVRGKVLGTIAHEISHQWMGNLVTPKWWSDIWLSEGFAAYFEVIGRFKFYPEFDLWQRFYVDRVGNAMRVDAGEETHPLRNNGENRKEVDAVFDTISYSKGSAIVRMMGYFLGTKTLCSGLRGYLKEMAYQAVDQDDLFRHMQNVSGNEFNIKDIMETWTLQTGYPLVRAKVVGQNLIQLEQEEFRDEVQGWTKGKLKGKGEEERKLWQIPVRVMGAGDLRKSDLRPDLWLRNRTTKYQTDTTNWVVINPEAAGYYRVKYDDYLTLKILEQLYKDATAFPPTTRAQMLNDVFTLHFSGHLTIKEAMRFTKYLGKEGDIGPWSVALGFFERILKLVGPSGGEDDGSGVVENYVLGKISSALEKIGFEQVAEEKGNRVILRGMLLGKACALGQTQCQEYGKKQFQSWMETGRDLTPPDLKPIVYCEAVSHKTLGREALEFLLEVFEKREDMNHPDSHLYLNAMACSQSEVKIKRLFKRFKSYPARLRHHSNKLGLLSAISGQKRFQKLALEVAFGKENNESSVLDVRGVSIVISGISKYVYKAKDIKHVKGLMEKHWKDLEKVMPKLIAALRTMESNRRWISGVGKQLVEWVSHNSH